MDSFFGIGLAELFFIAIIALVVLGPERLPGAIREVSKFIRMVRNLSNELTSQFSEEMKAFDDINPQKILRDLTLDPDEEKAANQKPGVKPAPTKSAATKTTTSKPTTTKPGTAKTTGTKPATAKPAATQSTTNRPATAKATEAKVTEAKNTESGAAASAAGAVAAGVSAAGAAADEVDGVAEVTPTESPEVSDEAAAPTVQAATNDAPQADAQTDAQIEGVDAASAAASTGAVGASPHEQAEDGQAEDAPEAQPEPQILPPQQAMHDQAVHDQTVHEQTVHDQTEDGADLAADTQPTGEAEEPVQEEAMQEETEAVVDGSAKRSKLSVNGASATVDDERG